MQGTGLDFEFINAHTVAIIMPASAKKKVSARPAGGDWTLARVEGGSADAPQAQATVSRDENGPTGQAEDSKGVPEILVKGKRTLNTDIVRTEDAPQPYVVFGREELQRSQAVNLEEFLRTRLPMNTSTLSAAQRSGDPSTVSSINLRGLGENQTLILVDGRRMPGGVFLSNPIQPDINGIPLAAIERIEVLPSTASGIYGGSATGGVINIILRRDFQGLDGKVTYANTFDTDAGSVRLDASAGFSLEGGRTQVMIAATRSETNNLLFGDRDFSARAIALQLENNRGAIEGLTTPPLGATANIRAVSGNLTLKPQYGGGGALISSITNLPTNITHLPLGYAGPASDGGAALRANAGRYNVELARGLQGKDRGLMSAPSLESASVNVRREFARGLEAFIDLSRFGNYGYTFSSLQVPNSVTNLPANAPNNPFNQAIAVRFPTPGLSFRESHESITQRATAGLIFRLPRDWMGETSYGWSQSRLSRVGTASILDPVGACVLGRGVGPNVVLGAPGPTTPCTTIADSRPALNVLQEANTFPFDFTPYLFPSPNSFYGPADTILKNGTLRLSGPVLRLPGGPLRLSALLERRAEEIQDIIDQNTSGSLSFGGTPSYQFTPHRYQAVNSGYLEARAPLARALELQASVRRDEYTTRSHVPATGVIPGITSPFFSIPSRDGPFPALTYRTGRLSSTDYTVGLRYAPVQSLALRTSFGTGFLPPSVMQIAPSESTVTNATQAMFLFSGFSGGAALDPKRGNTPAYVGQSIVGVSGGRSDLKPERSESWSAGLILTPRFAPGLRLSVDYTRIEKTDEIQTPVAQFVLENEDDLPGRIVRGENLATDTAGWEGPITRFDLTFINIARTLVEAWDIQADYTLDTARFGGFRWYAIATWQPHYRNRLLPEAPATDRVGFSGGPLERRGNLGFDWDKGPLTLSWNAQFYDSYRVYSAFPPPLTPAQIASRDAAILNQGSDTIPRQSYHDLIATWRFDAASSFAEGLLANSEISVGIQNLFDRSPPILATTSTTSPGYSTLGDPRLRRYSISLRKSFQ